MFGDFSKYIKVAFGADRGDMMFLGWAPSTIEAWGGMYQVLDGERANQFANNSGFDNPVFDSLLLKARSQPTQAASTQIYGQAEAIVMAEAPWVPCTHNRS